MPTRRLKATGRRPVAQGDFLPEQGGSCPQRGAPRAAICGFSTYPAGAILRQGRSGHVVGVLRNRMSGLAEVGAPPPVGSYGSPCGYAGYGGEAGRYGTMKNANTGGPGGNMLTEVGRGSPG